MVKRFRYPSWAHRKTKRLLPPSSMPPLNTPSPKLPLPMGSYSPEDTRQLEQEWDRLSVRVRTMIQRRPDVAAPVVTEMRAVLDQLAAGFDLDE
jgi:hypothetical protein